MLNKAIFETRDFTILQSYQTKVAYFDKRTGEYFRTNQYWSRTTSKHINQWLDGVEAKEVDQSVLDNLV